MDSSLLCLDEQTFPPAPPTNRQTWDLQSRSPTKGPDENMSTSDATEAESVLEAADVSAEPGPCRGCRFVQTTDSYDIKSLTSSCHLPERMPADTNYCTSSDIELSETIFPALSCLPQQSDFYSAVFTSQEREQTLAAPFTHESHKLTSSDSSGLLEPSNHTPACDRSQVTSSLRSLSNHMDSLEGEIDPALVSDLYIFESEQPSFILHPDPLDPRKITCPAYQPLLQLRGNSTLPECDPHTVTCDTDNLVSQCRPGSSHPHTKLDYESDVSRQKKHRSSLENSFVAGKMSVSDAEQRTAEVPAVSSPTLSRRNSPVELWLDACQYLAVEDVENKDNTGPSVTQEPSLQTSDLPFPERQTQVSGYNSYSSDGIGWSETDTLAWGPPVERWSSVDSWSSALSDWNEIFTALPEDLTAAFTEIGAEIDALRLALVEVNTQNDTDNSQKPQAETHQQIPMGVQDQPLKTQKLPETPILSGQSYLTLCGVPSGPDLQDLGTSSLCPISSTTQQEIQSSQSELSNYPAVPVLLRPTSLDNAIHNSTSTSDMDLFHFDGKVESKDVDNFITCNQDIPVILRIVEDTDCCDLEGKPIIESLSDGLCEVTDENRRPVTQLALGAKQEAGQYVAGTDCKVPGLHRHNTWTSTTSHVPGVDTQPEPKISVHTHVSCDTLPKVERGHLVQLQRDFTEFITPVAPLGGSSFQLSQKDIATSKDQDPQSDRLQFCIPDLISDGITCSFSLDNATLIHTRDTCAEVSSLDRNQDLDSAEIVFANKRTSSENIGQLGKELSGAIVPIDNFFISEENRIAVLTLDLNDPFAPRPINQTSTAEKGKVAEKMPHKSHKSTLEHKLRSKKDKCGGHHTAVPVLKKQDVISSSVLACRPQETYLSDALNLTSEKTRTGLEEKEGKLLETTVAIEKAATKTHGKKKKKHGQNANGAKMAEEPLGKLDNAAKSQTTKGRVDMFEATLGPETANKGHSQHPEAKIHKGEHPPLYSANKDHQPKHAAKPPSDDVKRRRLSQDKFGKILAVLEPKLQKADFSRQTKGEDSKVAVAPLKKAYSEAVKQKLPPKEEPKVVKSITAQAVSGDPQSLCLWCQFTAVSLNHTVTWSKDSTVVSELKRSAGDESRASLTILKASHKDLGKYQCRLASANGTVVLDYLLTYEVLSEFVIPPSPTSITSVSTDVDTEKEDVQCSRLMFREDFLSEQYFGEKQPVSIITEKVHFGEGMHRRAFRTRLQTGHTPLSLQGGSCVLKVHNSISYGTKSNEELVQKNFNLAVEECHVQNTAREYIKAYMSAAQSIEAFGEIPEIIPIYLVHRPSNDIPYATLEQELIGDFVKYSVKDGKEINLMRRDSEAGQKCCAFQHWVYQKTDGNLLVTDMQGVGMKLTDVGIATCKKGYKGFKGNCATSFIDQFKALHQCNQYCEILGLISLQPKAKKPASSLKPKAQQAAAAKKKMFGPTVKGKS